MTRNSSRSGSTRSRSDAAKKPAYKTVGEAVDRKARRTPGREENQSEIGFALALLRNFYWVETGIRSYLRSRDNLEFSRAEGLVVASVMLGYLRPSDIARQLGVSRQAIHVTIQQMRQKGIVDLVPDPGDGRIKQVVLTKLAQRMNQDGVVAMEVLWKELGKRLGQPDLNRVAKVLKADWGPPVLFDEGAEDSELLRR